ncbi:MAG: hypothetical protein ACI9MC_003596, partial [Kiritimatiellia bacterium]
MTRLLLPATLLAFVAGCNSTVNGVLVNGLNDSPIAGKAADAPATDLGLRVVAKAVKVEEDGSFKDNTAAGLTCMSFSAQVQPDGSFSIGGICLSQSDYMLSVTDKQLFLGDIDLVEQGSDVTAPITLKAWRTTNGAGVWSLKGDDLTSIKSRQNIASDTIKGSTEAVWYPEGLPKRTPLVDADSYLVIGGKTNANMELTPLINSGPREFALAEGLETPAAMPMPWSYIGTSFTDDATFERVGATIDDSKVVKLEKRGHVVRIIPASAIAPQGRMVL